MIPAGELRIEKQMTNPPKPIGVVVFVEGQPVAVLTYEQLSDAIGDYNIAINIWKRVRK